MVRKLSLAVALVLGISPFSTFAVGLGNIHLNSALNQYFDAEIDLLSVDQDEIADIKVTLASPDAFRRSGIERPFILSKLRFNAEETADGKTVIRVSSRDPIREPFLNFLIEVNWPKGKLLREYTVLLDPPVTLDRRPAPVQQAPMQRAPSRQMAAPAARTPASPGGSAVAPSDVAWAGSPSVSEYGPTQRNDTLWGIAKQVRTSGASMEQMMIALQRANPQAFINQNINNLKVGQILRVPKADEVQELSRREASIAYREQLQDWQADSKPTEMPADTADADQPMATESPVEVTPEPAVELKIASARPSGEGEAGPSEGASQGAALEQLKQDLIASEEAKEAALQEAENVRSRVDDLESQLEDLQRLLSLKSEQLSRLQAGVAGTPEAAEETPVMAEGAEGAAEGEGSPVMAEPEQEIALPAEGETAEADVPAVMEEAVVDAGAPEEPPVAAEPVVTEEESSPVMEEAPKTEMAAQPAETAVEPAPEEDAKPTPQPAPAKDEGLLDMITGDTTMLGVAVAGIVVLLALLWVAVSRRRSSSADFQESILISTIDEGDSEQVMDEISQEPASHPTEETSFLSDFSPSDIDALQDETGEVDPLAEADVYIAYGRYQQAEELIRQAIEKFPERPELKHKLLEILYATKDKDAFVALAESAAAEGLDRKDPIAWGKIVTMGAQLAAGHALFAGGEQAGQSELDDDELTSLENELGLDNGLDLDEVSTTVDLIDQDATEELESVSALDLDKTSEFSELDDLDDFSLDSELLKANLDEISTDLGFEPEGSEQQSAPEADEEMLSLEEGDSLTLDADTDISMVTESGLVNDDDTDADLTLSELDTEGLLEEDSAFSIEDPLESAEMDDLKLDAESEAEQLGDAVLDFSDSLALEEGDSQIFDSLELDQDDADAPLELDESFSLDDLDQEDDSDGQIEEGGDLTDEINTKLDLARAYVDMEDADGAKSILDEVVKEGNDGQQAEARKLLDQLS
ncbi:FimV/HubP family polar landmark protein [Sedimenticola selenatireducens]|uniref:FimV/HubP family polar landmark protein n=1 Tax=Sedimenticola selenatireducens TaxID=191960 RepID=UPI00048B728B|nr:FimV/HubP family polar landmark protein [Sedimenticola selenatireducens]